MQNVPQEWREAGRGDGREMFERRRMTGETGVKDGGTGGEEAEKESVMMELTRLVQKTMKESSWWERRGIDCCILAAAFLCLPPGKKHSDLK